MLWRGAGKPQVPDGHTVPTHRLCPMHPGGAQAAGAAGEGVTAAAAAAGAGTARHRPAAARTGRPAPGTGCQGWGAACHRRLEDAQPGEPRPRSSRGAMWGARPHRAVCPQDLAQVTRRYVVLKDRVSGMAGMAGGALQRVTRLTAEARDLLDKANSSKKRLEGKRRRGTGAARSVPAAHPAPRAFPQSWSSTSGPTSRRWRPRRRGCRRWSGRCRGCCRRSASGPTRTPPARESDPLGTRPRAARKKPAGCL